MTTFAIMTFTIIFHYYGKIKRHESPPTKTNSFCVGRKKSPCFTLKNNADKHKRFLQITFIMDVLICNLAWTKDCGHSLGRGPRQGQEVRRDSPCPATGRLSWPSGSLRAGRVSCVLEPAPAPAPWETTRAHKAWFAIDLKVLFFL